MSDGSKIDRLIAHRCENCEEKENKMARRENQEIRSGIFEDPAEKARHTANTGKTSIMTFRGIDDDKQSHGVFDGEGIDTRVWALDDRKNIPYTNESTKYITSPVPHGSKSQVWYPSSGRPENASAFEIRICIRSSFRSAQKGIIPG